MPARHSCSSATTASSPPSAPAARSPRSSTVTRTSSSTLDDNVRQHDPAEREALAELRHGVPADAVAWYADHDRIHVQPTRIDTLVAMIDAWAADVDAGHDTALLAWRRDDVADLNRLARDRWDRLGRHRRRREVHPGRCYAAGDRLVALAPHPEAGIVTSEPLQSSR